MEQGLTCVPELLTPSGSVLHKGDTPVPDVLPHIPLQQNPWALQTMPCLRRVPSTNFAIFPILSSQHTSN